MNQVPLTFATVTERPSAFLPMAMSLIALALLVGNIGADFIENGHIFREVDEGTVAHVWQLLMAGQLPILAFFAFKWLRRSPRQAFESARTASWGSSDKSCRRLFLRARVATRPACQIPKNHQDAKAVSRTNGELESGSRFAQKPISRPAKKFLNEHIGGDNRPIRFD